MTELKLQILQEKFPSFFETIKDMTHIQRVSYAIQLSKESLSQAEEWFVDYFLPESQKAEFILLELTRKMKEVGAP